MDVLTISSAHSGAHVALVREGVVLASQTLCEAIGLAAALPGCIARLLDGHGPPALVAAITGPGSFTGLRAGLSVAHGLAMSFGTSLMGVTAAEALGRAAGPLPNGRHLWVAVAARTGHVFLDRAGVLASYEAGSLPVADGPVAVAGGAANLVAASLAARGTDVMLLALRMPASADIAAVALARWRGELSPIPTVPLYGEAALARPAPAGRGAPA